MRLYVKDSLEFGPGWISSSCFSPCGLIMRMMGFFGPVEQFVFFLGGLRNIPLSSLWIPSWDGEDHGSTWRIKLRPLKPLASAPSRTQRRNPWIPRNQSTMILPPPTSSSSHRGSPSYPKMVSRGLIPLTVGYLGGSSLYSIMIA
jgi:hypothetical protein